MADIARIAIDDAVSNPGSALSHSQVAVTMQLYRNRTVVPPGTSRFRVLNRLLDQVKIALAFQGRFTKVITGPMIFMSRVFP